MSIKSAKNEILFEEVFEIDQASQLFHEGSCVFLPLYNDYCQWLSVINTLNNKVIYHCVDGKKVGYLLYNYKGVFSENREIKNKVIKVYTLFVSKPFRHLGYGTALIKALLSSLDESIESVELKCKKDLYVGDFYRKRDFKFISFNSDTDELLYRLDLN